MWAFPLKLVFRGLFSPTRQALLIFSTWKGQYFISATIMVKTALSKSGLKVIVLPKWYYCVLFSKSCLKEREEREGVGKERERERDSETKNRVSRMLSEDMKDQGRGYFETRQPAINSQLPSWICEVLMETLVLCSVGVKLQNHLCLWIRLINLIPIQISLPLVSKTLHSNECLLAISRLATIFFLFPLLWDRDHLEGCSGELWFLLALLGAFTFEPAHAPPHGIRIELSVRGYLVFHRNWTNDACSPTRALVRTEMDAWLQRWFLSF